MTSIYGIKIDSFLKSIYTFERFRIDMKSDRDKAGAIQAFEFCFELSWKVIKKILKAKGIETRSPRDAFREGAQTGIIKDPKKWFLFLEKRNLTSHTYDEFIVEEILLVFDDFSLALKELLDYIKNEQQKSILS